MGKRWTEKDIQILKENYGIIQVSKIGIILDRSKISISNMAIKLKLKSNLRGSNIQYDINETFFDIWSNNMAYLLGYITGDGCIMDDNRLILQCKNEDLELLNFSRLQLSPTRPIQFKNKTIRLEFKSIYLANTLRKFNIIPRKSLILELPIVLEKYKCDYLRGLFDADGCFHYGDYLDKRTNKYYRQYNFIVSSGSVKFLKQVQTDMCFGFGNIRTQITNKGQCSSLRISNKKHIRQIFKFLYNDGFYLKRKYNKFLESGLIL